MRSSSPRRETASSGSEAAERKSWTASSPLKSAALMKPRMPSFFRAKPSPANSLVIMARSKRLSLPQCFGFLAAQTAGKVAHSHNARPQCSTQVVASDSNRLKAPCQQHWRRRSDRGHPELMSQQQEPPWHCRQPQLHSAT